MSLDVLASHIASQGRGRDSALIHMSPREINSLRAMAQAHGGDLTINPATGLPEAGFLEDILPAVAGFALNSFVPGLGEMTGLGSFAAPAIVGGITALTNGGDWEKGLRAGLGAYGGASLSEGLSGAGLAGIGKQATETAVAEATRQGLEGEAYNKFIQDSVADAMSKAGVSETLGAGFNAAKGAPIDFLKDNKWGLMALAAPALMSGLGQEKGSGAPARDPGNIRPYDYDPRTQRFTELPSYKASFADGGDVMADALQGVQSSALLQSAIAPKRGGEDSKAVYEYLMGRGPNPYLLANQTGTPGTPGTPGAPGTTGDQDATGTAAGLKPVGGASSTGAGNDGPDGSGGRTPQAVLDFLENETPAERDARMGKISDLLSNVGTVLSPIGTMARAAFNTAATSNTPIGYTIGRVSNFFSTPKTADQIAATPVSDAVGKTPAQIAAETESARAGSTAQSVQDAIDKSVSDRAANDARSAAGDYGWAAGGITALAAGGIGHLGGYSDGGRLLKGPGDGVSDDIPATIGDNKEPARLADGEFVIPARIVSELGNGSTNAGAKKLYAMMDRIQQNRRKTVGKNRVAVNSRADRFLPA